MFTIILVRHAKSSWAMPGQPDFERPLNDRGKEDAPVMGERLRKRKLDINAFVSSPAKRAKTTCKLFCDAAGFDKDDIQFREELYGASPEVFRQVISELKDKHTTVAIFSHNPGITDFVNSLGTGIRIDNMPTCGMYAVTMEMESWKDFDKTEKKFLFFDYPKLKV